MRRWSSNRLRAGLVVADVEVPGDVDFSIRIVCTNHKKHSLIRERPAEIILVDYVRVNARAYPGVYRVD